MKCPKCEGELPSKGRLTPLEKRAADTWKAVTGFEMLNLDDVREGRITFTEAFRENVRWLEGVLGTASNIFVSEIQCDCPDREV